MESGTFNSAEHSLICVSAILKIRFQMFHKSESVTCRLTRVRESVELFVSVRIVVVFLVPVLHGEIKIPIRDSFPRTFFPDNFQCSGKMFIGNRIIRASKLAECKNKCSRMRHANVPFATGGIKYSRRKIRAADQAKRYKTRKFEI